MKISKITILMLLIVPMVLVLIQCTKYKEEAPFFDGLYLEYHSRGTPRFIYTINTLSNKKYKLLKTTKSIAFDDETHELFVDVHGRVYKSSKERYKGKFSPIWLPVHKMKIGDTFDDRNTVTRKDKWEIWDVLVITDTPTGAESYYELKTGFWVGSYAKTSAGIGKFVLAKTNTDLPVPK